MIKNICECGHDRSGHETNQAGMLACFGGGVGGDGVESWIVCTCKEFKLVQTEVEFREVPFRCDSCGDFRPCAHIKTQAQYFGQPNWGGSWVTICPDCIFKRLLATLPMSENDMIERLWEAKREDHSWKKEGIV